MHSRIHRGGGSSPRSPPWDLYEQIKNQVFGLALIVKGVFSPLKSIVENFLGALPHLFSNFTVVFPFHLKSPPPGPPRILDKQLL